MWLSVSLVKAAEDSAAWLALLLIMDWGDLEDWSARRWVVTVLLALCLGVAS